MTMVIRLLVRTSKNGLRESRRPRSRTSLRSVRALRLTPGRGPVAKVGIAEVSARNHGGSMAVAAIGVKCRVAIGHSAGRGGVALSSGYAAPAEGFLPPTGR